MTTSNEVSLTTGLPNLQELANLQELVAQAMQLRKPMQLRNTEARDLIMAALKAAHQASAPWKTTVSPTPSPSGSTFPAPMPSG